MHRLARQSLLLLCLLVAAIWDLQSQGDDSPPAEPRRDAWGDELPAQALARIGTLRLRHGREVIALAMSPDGQTLASATGDEAVLWDLPSGRPLCRLPRGASLGMDHLRYTRDGRWLIDGGGEDGMLLVRRPRTADVAQRIRLHEQAQPVIRDIALSSFEPNLVAVHFMYELERPNRQWGLGVYTLDEGRTIFYAAPWYKAAGIFFGDGLDPKSIVYQKPPERADENYAWFRRDLQTCQITSAEPPVQYNPSLPRRRLEISGDGSVFATADEMMDATATRGVIRVRRGSPQTPHLGEPANPRGPFDLDALPPPVRLFPDESTVFSFSRDGQAVVFRVQKPPYDGLRKLAFDAATGQPLRDNLPTELFQPPSGIDAIQQWNSVEIRQKDTGRALGLWHWHGETPRQPNRFAPDIACVAASPDGKWVAATGWKIQEQARVAALVVWDVSGRRVVFEQLMPRASEPGIAAFSPDGRSLAYSRQHELRLVDTVHWRKTHELIGHHGAIWAVAFSPEGKRLASWSSDHTALVWSLASAPPK